MKEHTPNPQDALRDTGADELRPPAQEPTPLPPARSQEAVQRGGYAGMLLGLVLCLALGVLIFLGVRTRHRHEQQLQQSADASSIATVRVTLPTAAAGGSEITLPANVTGYIDTPIYSRSSGYLKQWFYDIGARVPAGALLAIVQSPEVDQQVLQAESDVKTAQSNLQLAQVTAARWQKLLKKNAVSRQEADQTQSDLAARTSTLAAQQANLARLEKEQSFEHIYAPFAGVITARDVDVGSLIQAGQNSTQQELFHLASIARLRVFVPVPEVDESAVRDGERVPVTVDAFPDQTFYGTLMRSAHAVSPTSRTLNVEVDIENPTGKLLPGAFAYVHLHLPGGLSGLRIPSNALLFRAQGLQVGVVQDGHVALRAVTIGHDYGATVEVIRGLTAKDRIVLDPSDSIEDGDEVRVMNPPPAAQSTEAAE